MHAGRFIQKIKHPVKTCTREAMLSAFTVPYFAAFGASCVAQTHNIQSKYPASQDVLVKAKHSKVVTYIYS